MEKFGKINGFKRKVLIVDDEMINREILCNILETNYDVYSCENGKQALEILSDTRSHFSLILMDLIMPEMDGFELLEIIRENANLSSVPVIVMTSEKSAEVKSIKMGASDFITKPYDMPEVILARCERIIALYENNSIIRSAEKDELTGLYTKEFFFEYIRQFEVFDGSKSMDAIVVNIEHFHTVNEMYGRETGDAVLRKTGEILVKRFGEGDCIGCRTDADSFYLYVNHSDNYDNLSDELSNALSENDAFPKVRYRIGIYQDVDKNVPAEDSFDYAKIACDKIRGDYTKHILCYSQEMSDKDVYNERLIRDIESSIVNKDFIVFYQPKYGIQGEKPCLKSAEALIRWKHPELGMISPGEFIPLFEKNGLIQKLDRYVWEEAAVQIGKWKDKFGVTVPVSVNVSRVDVYDPEFENILEDILKKAGITSRELMLEITESAYSEDADGLIRLINNLRTKGFRIEMDDFGSGYSSLNMITTIPIDVLKMDMKFIKNMNKDEKSLKLVELVVDIAKFLGVPVVAEGVEDEVQLNTLKEMGCDLIQGYYFSKPVPPEEFEAFIEKEQNS